MRLAYLFSLTALIVCINWNASGQGTKQQASVFTDPADAPIDYQIQGEYVDKNNKLAAQVVARGKDKFDVYFLQSGLPGAGWDPKSKKVKVEAKLDAEKGIATFASGGYEGTIDAKKKSLIAQTEAGQFINLPRVERKSPTIGAKPPEGAIVLFDRSGADEWKPGKLKGDLLSVPNTTKKNFTNFKLHIEFRTPFQPPAGGQGRGNSGVYLQGRYEVQVLDSFGLKGENNECGGLYGYRAPDVNMCLPPLAWQTYDVEYRTEKDGPTITVFHNGVKVHDEVRLKGSVSPGPINLQDHGNPVVYRNIWLVELK